MCTLCWYVIKRHCAVTRLNSLIQLLITQPLTVLANSPTADILPTDHILKELSRNCSAISESWNSLINKVISVAPYDSVAANFLNAYWTTRGYANSWTSQLADWSTRGRRPKSSYLPPSASRFEMQLSRPTQKPKPTKAYQTLQIF